jgi:hypothetical protein
MKYVSVKAPNAKNDLTKAELKAKMEKAVGKAFTQIEEKKYTRKFQGQGSDIYKVALVVGHYSEGSFENVWILM